MRLSFFRWLNHGAGSHEIEFSRRWLWTSTEVGNNALRETQDGAATCKKTCRTHRLFAFVDRCQAEPGVPVADLPRAENAGDHTLSASSMPL